MRYPSPTDLDIDKALQFWSKYLIVHKKQKRQLGRRKIKGKICDINPPKSATLATFHHPRFF